MSGREPTLLFVGGVAVLTVEKLEALLRPILDAADLELLDLKVLGSKGRVVFYVILDHRYRPVGIGELTKVSRRFEDLLDMDETIPREYALDITSPGVNHPLKYEWEYLKNVGRKLAMHVERDPVDDMSAEQSRPAPPPISGRKKRRSVPDDRIESFEAELTEVNDGHLHFDDGHVISLDRVLEARVKLPW
jgi:ribosome maturation factor RimP